MNTKTLQLYKIRKFYVGNLVPLLFILLVMLSCGNGDKDADAYGNFEAKEIIVSAESVGKILSFRSEEGDYIKKGEIVGIIDTAILYAQKEQMLVQKNVVKSKIEQILSQKNVTLSQLDNIKTEYKRIKDLFDDGAATSQQMDDISGKMDVVKKQIDVLDVQLKTIQNEVNSVDKQIDLINIKLNNCKIQNPVEGTILEKYCEEGEMAGIGKSLYKVAPLGYMQLKAYISGSQLSSVSLGDTVSVFVDESKGNLKQYKGVVNWVSPNAEFTPKIVQTREERVNLVYAMKVSVKNDGYLKIGMPAEVKF